MRGEDGTNTHLSGDSAPPERSRSDLFRGRRGAAEECMESACVSAGRAVGVTPQTDSSACLLSLVDPMLTPV